MLGVGGGGRLGGGVSYGYNITPYISYLTNSTIKYNLDDGVNRLFVFVSFFWYLYVLWFFLEFYFYFCFSRLVVCLLLLFLLGFLVVVVGCVCVCVCGGGGCVCICVCCLRVFFLLPFFNTICTRASYKLYSDFG